MSSALRGCESAPTELYDVALLDLDGVVYVGPDAVPGASDSLAAARERGMRLAFVTNNAARPPHEVADHLSDLGVAARPDEVVTSAQAAARHLGDRLPGGARVLVVGTTGLTEALRERGLVPVDDAHGQVDAVVEGYSPELTWALFAEGAVAINRGVPWVATNVDRTIPSARGPLPGNGAFVAAMQLATGREPVITGKPDPTMHRESVLRSGAERPIVVGDRLDTDIEGANAAGCDSLLVFTGVTTPGELLEAPERLRPTYLAADLAGLLTAHPQPERDGDAYRCGRWSAVVEGDTLRLTADGDQAGDRNAQAMDALRAMCAAWWARRDAVDGGKRPIDSRADTPEASDSQVKGQRVHGPRLRADGEAASEALRMLHLAD
ncbi:HAD-IIA family hydrolase [uncultured Jatrophihabitans sp.]|uniref:HAD-IIA family hydrolase n=1 Tax=uncultured Jatrophihabitans sp. TaxID=1610747 RepID=UPI0035CA6D80